jgi:hypothetical protein
LVAIPDTTSGNSAVTTGSAWVNASNAVTTPHWVSSGASISTASGSSATVQIFPGASFLPSNRSTSQEGLVNVRISSASLVCQSDVPANAGTRTYGATLTYSGTIGYWSYVNGSYQYTTLTLSNTNATDPLAAVPLTTTMVYPGTSGNPLYLSDFISSWSTPHGQIAERTNNGLFAVPGVVDIPTMPMRDSSGTTTIDPTSSVGVEVGDLSCAAADNR